jgi:hypothetical protein
VTVGEQIQLTKFWNTFIYPSGFVNGSWRWIEGKRKDDYAEGLWRVHDKLYDLTEFIVKHPGGKYWLEITEVRFIEAIYRRNQHHHKLVH